MLIIFCIIEYVTNKTLNQVSQVLVQLRKISAHDLPRGKIPANSREEEMKSEDFLPRLGLITRVAA